jgi:hypothetical protein
MNHPKSRGRRQQIETGSNGRHGEYVHNLIPRENYEPLLWKICRIIDIDRRKKVRNNQLKPRFPLIKYDRTIVSSKAGY